MATLVALLLVAAGALAPGRDPALLYGRACVACHAADGSGRGPGGTRLPGRNLGDARWQARRTDEALVAAILEGRDAMPSHKAHLTPEDARRLVREVIRPMARALPRKRAGRQP